MVITSATTSGRLNGSPSTIMEITTPTTGVASPPGEVTSAGKLRLTMTMAIAQQASASVASRLSRKAI